MYTLSVDSAATWFSEAIKDCMAAHIPLHRATFRKESHPWLTSQIRRCVRDRKYGSQVHFGKTQSIAVYHAFEKFAGRMKLKLSRIKQGSKAWWGTARKLSHQTVAIPYTPALRNGNVACITAEDKVEVLRDSFADRFTLAVVEFDKYSVVRNSEPIGWTRCSFIALAIIAASIPQELDISSATGLGNILAQRRWPNC